MHAVPSRPRPGISNETFGMILFLIAEVMFFAGLVSAYVVLRLSAARWHPPGLPPLVNWVTLGNVAILAASAVTMLRAVIAVRRDDPDGLKLHALATLVLGVAFLGVQAYESARLFPVVRSDGNIFGSVFYWFGWLHGAHVLGGLILLAVVFRRAIQGRYNRYRSSGVWLAALYWWFVVIVWAFLFVALYVV
jgi:cytochrome c oxidase subunit 3